MTTTELKVLLLELAPELWAVPFSVIGTSDPKLLGFAAGNSIRINFEGIRETAARLSDGDLEFFKQLYEQALLGLAIHETAHLLCEVQPSAAGLTEQTLAACANQFADAATVTVPWLGHEGHWIRACLHLHHRLEKRLEYFPLGLVFPDHLQLGNTLRWKDLLGDEPERMADATFATIRQTKPPAEFVDGWREFVMQWHQTYVSVQQIVQNALEVFKQ